jgi:hypothetical protein
MARSEYFDFYNATNEQDLVASLVTEAIHIYGHDVFYLPRSTNNVDKVLREDRTVEYVSNYPIEMYIKSANGFEGEIAFLSRFTTEVRAQVTLSVSITTFQTLVGQATGLARPMEGDLVYLPLDTKILVIKKVDKYSLFYQVGSLQMYDLVCEVFEYSNERLATGIDKVDRVEAKRSLSTAQWGTTDLTGNPVLDAAGLPAFTLEFNDEIDTNDMVQNRDIGLEAPGLIDFSENNPFSEDM